MNPLEIRMRKESKMIRSLFITIVTGSLLAFGSIGSGTAYASGHGHEMHDGNHHSMDNGNHGHAKGKTTGTKNGFEKKPAVGTKAICPVTGNEFTVSKDTKYSVYKGKYYAFCCPGCKPQFDKNPEKYLK
jgi:YHS domain-containing protein